METHDLFNCWFLLAKHFASILKCILLTRWQLVAYLVIQLWQPRNIFGGRWRGRGLCLKFVVVGGIKSSLVFCWYICYLFYFKKESLLPFFPEYLSRWWLNCCLQKWLVVQRDSVGEIYGGLCFGFTFKQSIPGYN